VNTTVTAKVEEELAALEMLRWGEIYEVQKLQ
jgi:hypothetical protein